MNKYLYVLKIIFKKFNMRLDYSKFLDKYFLEADTNEGYATDEEVTKEEASAIKEILEEIKEE